MMLDELLDVVSDTDQVLYQELRDVIYEKKLNFRVINGFICNSQMKLWIPRRHPNKKLFPLHLDCSVGGHVAAGEDYESAFQRETQEELNIDVASVSYKKIISLNPIEHGTSAFMSVYVIYSDITPSYNKKDFTEYYWLDIDELIYRLNGLDKGKSDLLPILKAIKGKL